MKKKIRLTESDLQKIVQKSVKRILKEGESEGWVVEPEEAQEAYEMAVQEYGKEYINEAIVRCLNDNALSDCLAYIFRMYDFRKWADRDVEY